MTKITKPLDNNRIGIFGKGGSGKSTVAVLLARALARQGYDVMLLDADSTNVGLHQALGFEHAATPLLDYFGGMVFSGGQVTCPVDDPTPLPGAEIDLGELPPDYVAHSPKGVQLMIAGKLGVLGVGAGCDGPVAKIARDFRVEGLGPNGVVLIDHKAGLEDTARGVLVSLDWALTVVDPTSAAVRLAFHLHRMVEQVQEGLPPATRHLEDPGMRDLAIRLYRQARIRGTFAVLNRVLDADMERDLRQALDVRKVPVVGVLGEDPVIQRQWLRGEPLESHRLAEASLALARRLEAAQVQEGIEPGRVGAEASRGTLPLRPTSVAGG